MFKIKLKELREKAGYTQIQLSEKIGKARGSVGNWEAGSREPGLETIKEIAVALNVKVSDLVDDVLEENEKTPALTDEDKEVIEKFKKLSHENQLKTLGYIDSMIEK